MKNDDIILLKKNITEKSVRTSKRYFPSLFSSHDVKDFFKKFDLDSIKDAVYYIREKE